MKPSLLLGVAALALAAGCSSHRATTRDHWSLYSIGPRIGRAFIGYDAEKDGDSYLDFQWRRKVETNLTVRRHFLNENPLNPFQAASEGWPRPRPVNSLFPEPWTYINWTLLDGPIATFDEGGAEEFWAGIGETLSPLGVVTSAVIYEGLGFPTKEEQEAARAAAEARKAAEQ